MIPPEVLEEIQRLNTNLENLHRDAQDVKEIGQQIRPMIATLKDLREKFKAFPMLAKQLYILNQIMLQVKKSSGTVSMLQTLLQSIFEMDGSRRRS